MNTQNTQAESGTENLGEADAALASSRQESILDIDGKNFPYHHHEIDGRQVLVIVDRHPAEEYLVFFLGKHNVLRDIGLDGKVHLKNEGASKFFTFKNDRSFRFELEGKREDWGAPFINEETLRSIAGVGLGFYVYQAIENEPDKRLQRGEVVDLTGAGIEKFYLEKALTVHVVNEDNGDEFDLEADKSETIEKIIARMYVRLGQPPKTGDRLRCESTGSDVFGFVSLTLEQYIKAGHCGCLIWIFVGGTGGASCL
jgi:hypothetical protein